MRDRHFQPLKQGNESLKIDTFLTCYVISAQPRFQIRPIRMNSDPLQQLLPILLTLWLTSTRHLTHNTDRLIQQKLRRVCYQC